MDEHEAAWILGETKEPPILLPADLSPNVKPTCKWCSEPVVLDRDGQWRHERDRPLHWECIAEPTPI